MDKNILNQLKRFAQVFYQLFILMPVVIAVFCHAETTKDLSQSTANTNAVALVQNQDSDHIDKIITRPGSVLENVRVLKTRVDSIEVNFKKGQNIRATADFGGGKILGNFLVTSESSEQLAKESEGNGYFETKLLLSDLPEDLQKKFGYDPDKVKQHHQNMEAQQKATATRQKAEAERQANEARQAEIEKKKKGAPMVWWTVVQVLNDGLLVDFDRIHWPGSPNPYGVELHSGSAVVLVGHPEQSSLAEDKSICCYIYEDGTYEYTDIMGSRRKVSRWVYIGPIGSRK